jgi:hypothetical protein
MINSSVSQQSTAVDGNKTMVGLHQELQTQKQENADLKN